MTSPSSFWPSGASARSHKFPRGLALLDEDPFLGGDRAGIHPVGEVIDGAAGDRVAFPDGPFDRGDAAVPRQQRGVIADAAELGGGQRFPA